VFALLKDWQGSDPTGWLMSEKIDGWRVLWNGAELVTRQGQVLDAPAWFTASLPAFALDCELHAGRGGFNEIQGRIRDGWEGLMLSIFDAPSADPFRVRANSLRRMVLPLHVSVIGQIRCKGEMHLLDFSDEIVAGGGEGAVIRDPRSAWSAGRSGDVLRWVPQLPAMNRR